MKQVARAKKPSSLAPRLLPRSLLDQASPHCLPVGVYSQAKPFKPQESAASQEPKDDDEQSDDKTPQKNSKKQKERKEADEE